MSIISIRREDVEHNIPEVIAMLRQNINNPMVVVLKPKIKTLSTFFQNLFDLYKQKVVGNTTCLNEYEIGDYTLVDCLIVKIENEEVHLSCRAIVCNLRYE